jgi:phage antirepressor YoqD-like protein
MSTRTLIENFGGKPIEFTRGDAFVNLTSMCRVFDRRPVDFLRLPGTTAFTAALAENLGVKCENLTSLSKGNFADGREQGTWAHPDLGLECARWLSPSFAIWCNRTIRKILADGAVAAPALPASYKDALKALVAEIEAKEALQLENESMRPKAEFFDAVASSDDTLGMNETAKLLGLGRNIMMRKLRGIGVLMTQGDRRNTPYQRYIDEGYFRVIESKWEHPETGTHLTLTTRVHQRGVEFLRKKLTHQSSNS